jgi:hypothetical protein
MIGHTKSRWLTVTALAVKCSLDPMGYQPDFVLLDVRNLRLGYKYGIASFSGRVPKVGDLLEARLDKTSPELKLLFRHSPKSSWHPHSFTPLTDEKMDAEDIRKWKSVWE